MITNSEAEKNLNQSRVGWLDRKVLKHTFGMAAGQTLLLKIRAA